MNILPNQNIILFDSEKSDSPKPIIAHPNFRQAYDELERLLCYSESKLIFVVGPTGAGKSTLKELLCQRLEQEFAKLPAEKQRGRLATISVDMPPPVRGSFSFGPVMYTLLSKLEIQDMQHVPHRSNWGGQDIMVHFMKVFRERQPLGCMLDEAQNLSLVGNPWHLLQNLSLLNSLANATSIKFVLFGTYDLVEAMNYYPALVRRVDIVRLESYVHRELESFVKMSWDVLKDLKFDFELDPAKDGEFLFERSLGSIGILRKWLQHAAIEPRLNGRKVTRTDLEAKEIPLSLLQSMLLNVNCGKDLFRETPEDLSQFSQMLLDLGSQGPAVVSLPKKNASRRGNPRPGVPTLRRYPVGQLVDQVRAAEK
jgi:energy-coupling factor transporter ATP-binding protein EcfA2